MSGRTTPCCLIGQSRTISDVAQTRVFFTELSDTDIEEYTRSGEPNDKAGAYAIQGLASKFVWKIEGCYHNVVGLPVSLVYSFAFHKAKCAPVGSWSTLNSPKFSIGVTSFITVAPSDFAFFVAA